MPKYRPVIERFREKCEVDITTGCWIWCAQKLASGYGLLKVGRKNVLAHRVSYTLKYGDIPIGMCVLHRCDNPSCVNPSHLFVGTHKMNSDDKISKNREAKGERNGWSKLTYKEICSIRNDKRTQKEIATEYGIVQQHVSRIKRRILWKHIA